MDRQENFTQLLRSKKLNTEQEASAKSRVEIMKQAYDLHATHKPMRRDSEAMSVVDVSVNFMHVTRIHGACTQV